MKARYNFLSLIFFTQISSAQFSADNVCYIFSGYIKYEAFFDTRQVVGDSVDQFLVFPERRLPSTQKIGDTTRADDINAKGQLGMAAFETRGRITVKGLQFNRAHVKAVAEADFFGRETATLFQTFSLQNVFRLRHAFAQFDWHRSSLIIGQTWHPIGPEEIAAESISFNAGNPFDLYARSPQITLCYQSPSFDISGSTLMQLEFVSEGPNGPSEEYMRNSVIPNFHLHSRCYFNGHVIGGGVDYKRLVPRIVTNNNFKVRESINSGALTAYLVLEYPKIQIHNKINFGQNVSDYGVIGGYAVKKNSIDPITDERKYTNLRTISFWNDITIRNNKKIEPAILIGAAKNLGASSEIEQDITDNLGNIIDRRIFGFGNDIDILFRIAPRVRIKTNLVTFAGELEYTRATFGQINNKGKVINTTPVANTRLLFAVFYYF